MVQRVLIKPDRLLLSRPGNTASESMPHAQKAFDSDWAYAGQLIAAGWQDDPASPSSTTSTDGVYHTTSSSPWTIGFPNCSFIPTVMLGIYYSSTYILAPNTPRGEGIAPLRWEYIQVGTASPYNTQPRFTFSVTTSQIIITRQGAAPGYYYRWPFALYYNVFGFAGP